MKQKQNPVLSIVICFLFIAVMNLIGSVCEMPIIFKESFSAAETAVNSGVTDYGTLINEVLEKAVPKLLEWNYVITLAADLLFIVFVISVCKFNPEKLMSEANVRPFDKKHAVIAAVIGLGCVITSTAVISFIMSVVPSYANEAEKYSELIDSASHGGFVLELILVAIIAPVTEELLCRGLIFRTLKKSFSTKWVIIISSLFFAYMHSNLYQAVYTFLLGLVIGFVAELSGSVIPAIIMHSVYNVSQYLYDLPSLVGLEEGTPQFIFVKLAVLILLLVFVPLAIWLIVRSWNGVDFEKKEFTEPEKKTVTVNFGTAPFDGENRYGQAPFGGMEYAPYKQNEFGDDDMAIDFIVAGLGNVGEKYASNRHNTGFLALDYIGLRENFTAPREKFRALTYEKTVNGKKVLFMKPQTMMNLSGEAVGEAARFYKLPAEKVLIIYDDINFDAGEMRIRPSGSAGGHNGIKSIIAHLGSENFPRIKVGVGKLPPERDLIDFVLSNPPESDMNKIISNMESVYEAAKLIIDGKLPEAQQKFN